MLIEAKMERSNFGLTLDAEGNVLQSNSKKILALFQEKVLSFCVISLCRALKTGYKAPAGFPLWSVGMRNAHARSSMDVKYGGSSL